MSQPIDAWTLIHFLGWLIATFWLLRKCKSLHPYFLISLMVLIGIGWEALEYIFGPFLKINESIANRCVDIVVDTLGVFLAYLESKNERWL